MSTNSVLEQDDRMDGTQPALGQAEALVLETFGVRLLAYLCASDEGTMLGRLEGKASLTQAGERVLTVEVVPLAQHVAAQMAMQPALPRAFALDVLGRQSSDGLSSIGSALRRAAGGESVDHLLKKEAHDRVKAAVTRMTIDAYPLLLLPPDRPFPIPSLILYRHPLRAELQDAVQKDTHLRQMFTEDDPGLGRRGYLHTSIGRGYSIQDGMFGERIIASAWDILRMTSQSSDLADLVDSVHRGVDVLRQALDGKPVTVPARLVFTGFTTHDGFQIPTPWGMFRPQHEWERELAPTVLQGRLSGTQQDGTQVTVSYAGEMVLETELPYIVSIERNPHTLDQTPLKFPNLKGADALRRRLEGLQLAALLATNRAAGHWVAARLAWTWVADPFGYGPNVSWSDLRAAPSFMPSELTVDECEDVSIWTGLVESHWTPSIDIAVRRFLKGANARSDMADRLVDSVIVWENLFGTSEGESRLRISAAMAWLLEKDAAKRANLQLQLKHLYDDRSRIVHGGTPDEIALAGQANAALNYAREMLRVLFRERPDVLALRDGSKRSIRMIMGLPE